MYNAKEYKETLEAVFDWKITEAEREQIARDKEYSAGYAAGLREALRTIKASAFLVGEA